MDNWDIDIIEGRGAHGPYVSKTRREAYRREKGLPEPISWKDKCKELEELGKEDEALIADFLKRNKALKQKVEELEAELNKTAEWLNNTGIPPAIKVAEMMLKRMQALAEGKEGR